MRRKYELACKHCRQKGHTPAECDQAPVKPKIPPLTETEFHMVKDVQRQQQWVSHEVADELRLPLKEVNAAFAYHRYETYLHYRRSKVMV